MRSIGSPTIPRLGWKNDGFGDRTEVLEAQRARPETRPPTEAAGWELPGERVDLTVPIRFNLK